jgi:hypothetical protein
MSLVEHLDERDEADRSPSERHQGESKENGSIHDSPNRGGTNA